MPEIPILCDPSHICGRRDLLASVAQKSLNLNFDGLMIESHIRPDEAWSDAAQQITPEVYGLLIENLVIRHEQVDYEVKTELDRLRKQIDLIDDELIHILASRMHIAREIGLYKKNNGITILQSTRWKDILDKFINRGQENGLSEEFLARFIKAVHDESINQQQQIIEEK